MAMRGEGELQGDLLMTWAEMPRSSGHVFYDRLQELLSEAGGVDAFVVGFQTPFQAIFKELGKCPASAPVRQNWRLEEGSDCLAGQAGICCHERLSRSIALRIVMSLRATATRAMSFGFPAATSLSRKLLSCGL